MILCGSREYILIREDKTWNEAQDYCRQNYIELATVQTDEEWRELNKLRAELQFYIWIGLYDDADSWHWSFQDETLAFFHWDFDQPNNMNGKQYCVTLRWTGYWWDEACNVTCPFFCQNGGKTKYFQYHLSHQSQNWYGNQYVNQEIKLQNNIGLHFTLNLICKYENDALLY